MPKFSKRAISDEELNSIVRYVQYAAKDPSNKGGWGIGFIGPVPEGIVTWWIAGTALVGLCILIGRRLRS
jgi:ubiquinol-cytochrome c reductase cytochrome c subunit